MPSSLRQTIIVNVAATFAYSPDCPHAPRSFSGCYSSVPNATDPEAAGSEPQAMPPTEVNLWLGRASCPSVCATRNCLGMFLFFRALSAIMHCMLSCLELVSGFGTRQPTPSLLTRQATEALGAMKLSLSAGKYYVPWQDDCTHIQAASDSKARCK